MQYSPTTIDLLRELVAFPTVSCDSNLELIDYIEGHLSGIGADVRTFVDDSGSKANLFATIGPEVDGGIVLSGHTDVVPANADQWASDPFRLTARDNRLYGRGTCDMKGFIATALALAPTFAAADLARPLHFAFTYDEEVGCLGARSLVDELRAMTTKPAIAIIGEPTEMRVIEGHKGCCEYAVAFSGLEGHASVPDEGVNAVEYAARYVAHLMGLTEALRDRAPASSRFQPPWTTLQVGRISGGVARNVIAGQCEIDWEMRPINKADGDYVKSTINRFVDEVLRPEMQALHPQADIRTEVIGEVEGLEPVPNSEAVRIAAELTGANTADLVSFGTEAGLFQSIDISTVVCGPGSIEQAHKPDEFITLDQLKRAEAMIMGLLPKLNTGRAE
jgi:acetylornithine deacetylase